MPLFFSQNLDDSIEILGFLVDVLNLYFAKKFLKANSVDPDQTPRSAASELGLHMSPNWVSSLKKGLTNLTRFHRYVLHCSDNKNLLNGMSEPHSDTNLIKRISKWGCLRRFSGYVLSSQKRCGLCDKPH